MRLRQVFTYLRDHPPLGTGQPKRQAVQKALLEFTVTIKHRRTAPALSQAQHTQAELMGEQLLQRQPALRRVTIVRQQAL